MKEFVLTLVVGIVALSILGCGGAATQTTEDPTSMAESGDEASCDCQEIASGTGWCDKCNIGFIDGKQVACKGCVEAALNGTECPHCTGDQS